MCLQVDLEPEGKVYVLITLTGSFTDGKAADALDKTSAQCVPPYVGIA